MSQSFRDKHKYVIAVWLLFFASIIIHSILVLQSAGPFLYGDELLYKKRASEIFYFHTYESVTYPPMYPFLISFAFLLKSNFYLGMKLINVLLISSTIWSVWKLCRLFTNERKSLLCVIISMLFPWQYMISPRIISENLFVPLLLFVCYYYIKTLENNSRKERFILGCLIAILHLTRHITLVLLPVFAFVWLLDKNDKNKWRLRFNKEKIVGGLQIVLSYGLLYFCYILFMLFKGNTLLGILGFSISSGIGSESIKNYATVGSLVTFIVIYICYCVLSFSFMIPVCGKELIQIIKGKGEGLYSKFVFLTMGLTFMATVASIRHSWRSEYNYPEILHILGRYIWPIGLLLVVLFVCNEGQIKKERSKKQIAGYTISLLVYIAAILILVKQYFFDLGEYFLSDFNVKDIYYLQKYDGYIVVTFLWIVGLAILFFKREQIKKWLTFSMILTLTIGTVSTFFFNEIEQDGIYGKKLSDFNTSFNLGKYDFLLNKSPMTNFTFDLEFWTMQSENPVLADENPEILGEKELSIYYEKYYPNTKYLKIINEIDYDKEQQEYLDSHAGIIFCEVNNDYVEEPMMKFWTSDGEFGIYEYPVTLKEQDIQIIQAYPASIYGTQGFNLLANGNSAMSIQTNEKNKDCLIYIDNEFYAKSYINESGVAAFELEKEKFIGKTSMDISFRILNGLGLSTSSNTATILIKNELEISATFPIAIDSKNGFNVQSNGNSAMSIITNLSNDVCDIYADSEKIATVAVNAEGICAFELPEKYYRGKKYILLKIGKAVYGKELFSEELRINVIEN